MAESSDNDDDVAKDLLWDVTLLPEELVLKLEEGKTKDGDLNSYFSLKKVTKTFY
jgi:hypothetical protein